MQLQDIFTPGRIKTALEAEDKDEVFEEMVDLLINSYGLDARDEILSSLHERERKMSTGIKTGIAIPHAKTEAVDGLFGVIGISKEGIEYEALDGKPVYILFLLVSSPEKSELHLKALQKIAMLLDDPAFYADMMKAENPEAAFSVLKKYEERTGFQE